MSFLHIIHKAPVPLLALLFAFPGRPDAQSIKSFVDSQDYVFQPRMVEPMHGPSRNVATYNYILTITKDRIVSELPYFGRAYIAPMDPTKGVLEFTLKHFDYRATPGKKEGWNVVIKPKDNKDIQELHLNISPAGYATLSVIPTNSDAISFTGIITAPSKR